MNADVPADIQALDAQLDAIERDAEALVAGLSEEDGTAQPAPGSWSVAQCLDHLATGNRVYLVPMQTSARDARARGNLRSRAATPGWVGRMFIASFEPPPKWWSRMKAPRSIRPRPSPPLAAAFTDFMASHADLRAFVREHADLDLAGVRFSNPFIRGLRFSLATGLQVLAAHERRHLWQAWRVRELVRLTAEGRAGLHDR